jgi:hypothetical protein
MPARQRQAYDLEPIVRAPNAPQTNQTLQVLVVTVLMIVVGCSCGKNHTMNGRHPDGVLKQCCQTTLHTHTHRYTFAHDKHMHNSHCGPTRLSQNASKHMQKPAGGSSGAKACHRERLDWATQSAWKVGQPQEDVSLQHCTSSNHTPLSYANGPHLSLIPLNMQAGNLRFRHRLAVCWHRLANPAAQSTHSTQPKPAGQDGHPGIDRTHVSIDTKQSTSHRVS